MKINIEYDSNIKETEITIKCNELNHKIKELQDLIIETYKKNTSITFYNNDKEYYISLNKILFFETTDNTINAHTTDNIYKVKYKLYELEEILPKKFIRISKSTIVNTHSIYSINHNIASSSLIQFNNSHKQVYVSRFYYKNLKQRLDERRNYEN